MRIVRNKLEEAFGLEEDGLLAERAVIKTITQELMDEFTKVTFSSTICDL